LRRVCADAHITLATRSWAHGIFEDADFINEVLPFDKEDSVFNQAKNWRNKKFDLAILFPNSFESALVATLAGVKKRIGYATDGRGWLLSQRIAVPEWKNTRHEIYYYLNIVRELENNINTNRSFSENNLDFKLSVSEERRAAALEILIKNGVDSSKKIVALCPGSTNSRAKRWHAESYAKLNDKLQNGTNLNVVLIGSRDEFEVSEEVVEKSQLKPIVLTGKTSLSEVTSILSVCDLLISNDTGPAHIATAVGTKTAVIFGPTNPLTTHPVNADIIRKPVACSPCMLRDCPIDHRCMTEISVEEVFDNAIKLLKI
jgi:heptosyltransferase-2